MSLRRSWDDLAALIWPSPCVHCGTPGPALCRACAGMIAPRPHRVGPAGDGVQAGGTFEGVLADVLRAIKREQRIGLAPVLAPVLRAALRASVEEHPGPPALLVTVPTTARAWRARGWSLPDRVLAAMALRPEPLLRWARQPAEQRTLGRGEREVNLAGALAVRAVRAEPSPVVIVDDVLTSGATLREARRALQAAGWEVRDAVVIAATPARSALYSTSG